MSWQWIHAIDPVAVRLFGLEVHWYGLSYLVGILAGWWLICRWQRRGMVPSRDPRFVGDFVTTIGIAMVLGGRLGYCLFYEPALFTKVSSEIPWWGVLMVHKGGMASHGGLIGFAVGCWWFTWRRRLVMGVMGDHIAAVAPVGVVFGRLANFVNGELYGRPTDGTWGVRFPQELPGFGSALAPAPDSADWAAWAMQAPLRHPSQLYAMLLEGLILAAIIIPIHLRHRRPWLTAGFCFALYAVGRFIGECWRLPDAGQPGGPPGSNGISVPAYFGFMSKGQLLTIPFFIVGIALAIWAWRRGPRPEAYAPAEPDSGERAPGDPAR